MSEQRDREDTFDTILFVTLAIFCSAESAMQLLACGCSPKKSPKICPLDCPLAARAPRAFTWEVRGDQGGAGEHALSSTFEDLL